MADLGVTKGHMNDLTRDWLHLNGATSENVNDCWKQYNALQNAKKNVNDSWYQWLGALFHFGHIADRWKSFWSS